MTRASDGSGSMVASPHADRASAPSESRGSAGVIGDDRTSWIRRAVGDRDLQRMVINILAILIIGMVAQAVTGSFFTLRNMSGLAIQIQVVTMIACAMTLVMVAGAIDVSVSGVVVLAGIAAGKLMLSGTPTALALALAVALGGVVGLVNSFLVIVIKIPPLIATIGTLYASIGVGSLLTNGLPVAGLPSSFSDIGSGSFLGLPIAVYLIAAFVLVFSGLQRFTGFGRHVIATGSNTQAAFLNGVNVKRTLTVCFVLSGAAAGWGGIVYASRIGSPSPVLDNDLLFYVIVAIVVGGTGLLGGEGRVFGSFLGAVLLGVVNNALNLAGISAFWQYIALGILLVCSVSADVVMHSDAMHRVKKLFTRTHPAAPDG
jgi:ribose transport system permease protein